MMKGGCLACLMVAIKTSRVAAQDGGEPVSQVDEPQLDPPQVDQEEAAIAAELAAIQGNSAIETVDPVTSDTAASNVNENPTASSRGLSNLMNPAISVNGLLLGGYSNRHESEVSREREDLFSGFHLQEAELQLSAIVDPYLRGDVTLAGNIDGVAFEEAYVSTLEIPRLTIRAGLFKASVGRHNELHTHAFPFLTGPLPWRALLGPEGLSDPGLSVELLLPLPFYAELKAQVFEGEWPLFEGSIADHPATAPDESEPDRRDLEDFAYVGQLRALFDLHETTTIELGATYVGGRNGFRGQTSLAAGHAALKWRPIESARYTSFEWQTEWVWVHRPRTPGEESTGGGYTHLRYQFEQQWWVQVRAAVLGVPGPSDDRIWRGEVLGAHVLDEFAALRLQYGLDRDERANAPFVHDILLQLVFSMGPHPAHAY